MLIRRVGAALAGPGLADALAPMLTAVRRHLLDEEDIVVPALVARGHLVISCGRTVSGGTPG